LPSPVEVEVEVFPSQFSPDISRVLLVHLEKVFTSLFFSPLHFCWQQTPCNYYYQLLFCLVNCSKKRSLSDVATLWGRNLPCSPLFCRSQFPRDTNTHLVKSPLPTRRLLPNLRKHLLRTPRETFLELFSLNYSGAHLGGGVMTSRGVG